MTAKTITQFPIPPHFDAAKVGEVWRVSYQDRTADARNWAKSQQIKLAFVY